jgi:arginine/ornithine N-succinyltransferase beta subunit
MICATDQIRTIRESRELVLKTIVDEEPEAPAMYAASGRLTGFAAACANVLADGEDCATLSRASARLLGLEPGDSFLAMGR